MTKAVHSRRICRIWQSAFQDSHLIELTSNEKLFMIQAAIRPKHKRKGESLKSDQQGVSGAAVFR